MEPGVYRNKWSKVKKSADPKYELSQLSRKVGFSFVDRFYQKGSFEPQYIDLLCEMATSFSDTELNNVAASALFEIIVACMQGERYRDSGYWFRRYASDKKAWGNIFCYNAAGG